MSECRWYGCYSNDAERRGHGQETLTEKIGSASFYKDDDGVRRMKLIIDMGRAFHTEDITVQYIKDDRILASV